MRFTNDCNFGLDALKPNVWNRESKPTIKTCGWEA
jgi:hypothetical protein